MTFRMGLREGFLDALEKEPWWQDVLAYKAHPLSLSVRDEYVSVYANGCAVFTKIEFQVSGKIVAQFNRRYMNEPGSPAGKVYLSGSKMEDKEDGVERKLLDRPFDFQKHVDKVLKYHNGHLMEKECLAVRAIKPETVNLEMTLPGLGRKSRIDIVCLEENENGKVNLVFTESKLRKSIDLHEIIKQIGKYNIYISDNKDDILSAYRISMPKLIDMRHAQKLNVSHLLKSVCDGTRSLDIDPCVRLLSYRTERDGPFSEDHWKRKREKIVQAGIPVEEVSSFIKQGRRVEEPIGYWRPALP